MATIVVGLVGLSTLVGAKPSQAANLNGGFGTDNFTDWSTIGESSIETADFGSGQTKGTYEVLRTGDVYEGNLSSVPESAIESFLGSAAGSLDTLIGADAIDGSAIKQTFTAKAGDFLSFQWNFLTNEATPEPEGFNDFAFVSINGRTFKLADTFSSFFSSSSNDFDSETGLKTFSYTVPVDGTYRLGLGDLNVKDNATSSGLLVGDVELESKSVPVPEPDSGLGLLGFAAFCIASTWKHKKQ